ncbi:MAG: hypothetical protein AAFU64_17140, partial [Bacteroidota bacterium]
FMNYSLILLILVNLQSCHERDAKWFRIESKGLDYHITFTLSKAGDDADIYSFFKLIKGTPLIDKEEMISELINYKGDERTSDFIINYNKNLSQFYMGKRRKTTVEIQALFLINQLYFDNPYYYSPYQILIDQEGNEIFGSREKINEVFNCYANWFSKIKKMGMGKIKALNIRPLDNSPYRWMYGLNVSPLQPLQFDISKIVLPED